MTEEKKETKTSEQDWKTPLIVIGSVGLVLIIIGIILSVSNSGLTSNVVNEGSQNNQNTQENSKINCRQEQVPYEEQETYYETVPYEKEVPLKYNSVSTYIYNCGSIFDYYACEDVGITNTDTVGGTFKVNCKFRTLSDEFYDSGEVFVNSGERGDVTCAIDLGITEDVEMTFTVTPSTKEETDYKDVQRTKTITKYRTEEICN